LSELDLPFEEQAGSPASQQAKKLAREANKLKKMKKYEREFFTVKAGKVLHVIAKPHGAHSELIGKKSKIPKDQFEKMLADWKKKNQWISEEDSDEKLQAACKELAEQKEKETKK
jgi:hypothetical protein